MYLESSYQTIDPYLLQFRAISCRTVCIPFRKIFQGHFLSYGLRKSRLGNFLSHSGY
jgi:hypothetical protein